MSKLFQPPRKRVAPRPSRIRRDPVRIEPQVSLAKVAAISSEREVWGGVAGVLVFAGALVVLAVGISAATIFHDDPAAAARAARFGQCYNSGPNCVIDGGTMRVGGRKLAIAGVDAPSIQDARCEAERSRGIDAAVRLSEMLNGGRVTVGGAFRDGSGREVRKVQVGGADVGDAMVDAGVVRTSEGTPQDWCS
ncbi:MAG: thermonuclease family protein [Sphingomicrobium sp.]